MCDHYALIAHSVIGIVASITFAALVLIGVFAPIVAAYWIIALAIWEAIELILYLAYARKLEAD